MSEYKVTNPATGEVEATYPTASGWCIKKYAEEIKGGVTAKAR